MSGINQKKKMKEIDKIALIKIENGQILSTKSKGKKNIIFQEAKGKIMKATNKL
jgi:hypothetical protein